MAFLFRSGVLGDETQLVQCLSPTDLDNFWSGGATITAWVNIQSYGQSTTGRIVDKSNTGESFWLFYTDATSSGRFSFIHTHSDTQGRWATGTGTLPLNTWLHVSLSWDKDLSADPVYHIDGLLVSTVEVIAPIGSPKNDAAANMTIGGRQNYDRGIDGSMADFRIYSRALASGEVAEIFHQRGQDGIVEGLIRRFPMSPSRAGIAPNTPFIDGVENTVGNSTQLTINVPNNSDGDTLVLVVGSGGVSTTAPNIDTPTGWTQRMHVDLPSAPSRPTVAVYTRVASSEPSNYVITDDQTSHTWCAAILNMGEMTDVPTDTASTTGESSSPTSPSVTPGANAVLLRVVCTDGETLTTVRGDFLGSDMRVVYAMDDDGLSSDGVTLAIGLESRDGAASGTRAWNPTASQEWAGLTLSFLHGAGNEGLPCKDVSSAQAHAETWHGIVGADDLLTIKA